jgi:hypothetical protein
LDECVFGCCTIKQLIVPASLETVTQLSFYKAAIDAVVFEPGTKVRAIGDRALQYAKIKLITIPKSVDAIGSNVFAGDCRRGSSIESLVTESGSVLREVGDASFAHCTIKASVVPSDVRTKLPNTFPADSVESSKCCLIL